MIPLSRSSFFALLAGSSAVVANAPPPHVSTGSGLNGPANVVGSGHPLNLRAVTGVQAPSAPLKLPPNVIVQHYPPSNIELQNEINGLTEQIKTLMQNQNELFAVTQELTVFSTSVEKTVQDVDDALVSHWHDYDDGIGAHSTSRARM